MKYRQVTMLKKTTTGHITQTSYIPDQYAKLGKVVKLLKDETWEDGWEVIQRSDTAVDDAPDYRKAIRSHRKNTGDSMKKEVE